MFGKKISTTDLTQIALGRLNADMDVLRNRQDGALSVFRKTAEELSDINEQLAGKISLCSAMLQSISDAKSGMEQNVSDNEAVRRKILEIIGE